MASIPTTKELTAKSFNALKADFGYKNVMQAPRLSKVVVSVGVGSIKDKKKGELIVDRLSKITGQKSVARGAKKAIANFKTRLGDVVGYQTTLRGPRMYGFLDKLLNVALPRTADTGPFQGMLLVASASDAALTARISGSSLSIARTVITT
jgi:large subunit ribosomal protein L5